MLAKQKQTKQCSVCMSNYLRILIKLDLESFGLSASFWSLCVFCYCCSCGCFVCPRKRKKRRKKRVTVRVTNSKKCLRRLGDWLFCAYKSFKITFSLFFSLTLLLYYSSPSPLLIRANHLDFQCWHFFLLACKIESNIHLIWY